MGDQRWVALLRGVNVGRGNLLPMAAVREAVQAQGFSSVRTHLRSGNVVLTGPADPGAVVQGVGDAVEGVLGKRVAVLVRSADELAAVVAGNPFPVDPADRLHVAFLSGPVPQDGLPDPAQVLPDQLATGDRVLYLHYGGPSHEAPLTRWLARAKAAPDATTRNWRTVTALLGMVQDHP
jgi:uncharacterized protein (DUF1697 family)